MLKKKVVVHSFVTVLSILDSPLLWYLPKKGVSFRCNEMHFQSTVSVIKCHGVLKAAHQVVSSAKSIQIPQSSMFHNAGRCAQTKILGAPWNASLLDWNSPRRKLLWQLLQAAKAGTYHESMAVPLNHYLTTVQNALELKKLQFHAIGAFQHTLLHILQSLFHILHVHTSKILYIHIRHFMFKPPPFYLLILLSSGCWVWRRIGMSVHRWRWWFQVMKEAPREFGLRFPNPRLLLTLPFGIAFKVVWLQQWRLLWILWGKVCSM